VVNPARFDTSRSLRFHFNYLIFEAGDGLARGQFQPVVRNDSGPLDMLVAEGSIYSTRGAPGTGTTLAWGVLNVPQGARPPRMSFQYSHPYRGVIGPFASFGMRLEAAEVARGASIHTLYGKGGQSLRDMAEALQQSTDQTLTTYFSMVRRLGSRGVMIRINSGLNDRNEALPSAGPHPTVPGNSTFAYMDNLQAIVNRMEEIYRINAWNVEDLTFLVTPSHPVSAPDDDVLRTYRAAAASFARQTPRTACVDLSTLVDAPTMASNGWYFTIFDRNHLSQAGYAALARAELGALVAAANCAADIDASGGVDADDVVEFFRRWDENQIDYSHDGATDGDDVIAFFADWDTGCE
jgi:lysophospholipase L1-like esterase